MPIAEGFVTLVIPEETRRILKHASAESALPMHVIVTELVRHAYPQYATNIQIHEKAQPRDN